MKNNENSVRFVKSAAPVPDSRLDHFNNSSLHFIVHSAIVQSMGDG